MPWFPLLVLLLIPGSAYAIEKIECGGTEPFWDATLTNGQVTFKLADARQIALTPVYRPAAGASENYVLSVQARNRTNSLTGFVVNENLMGINDKNGRGPALSLGYNAYCSDGMSDRGFPFSVHLFVDGKPYTGCCETQSHPAVKEK